MLNLPVPMTLNAAILRALPPTLEPDNAEKLSMIIEVSVRDFLRTRTEPYDAQRDTMNMRLRSLDQRERRVYDVLHALYGALVERERDHRQLAMEAAPFSTTRERDWAATSAYEASAELARRSIAALFPGLLYQGSGRER